MTAPIIDRLALIGVGLIGGSIARAAREYGAARTIVATAHTEKTRRRVVELGIADQVKPKEKLKQGGYVADYIESGQAELGIHQISEILPHAGVTLVGPLPKEIQNYTVYAAGIGAGTQHGDAAKGLIASLTGPSAQALFKTKGMEPGGN